METAHSDGSKDKAQMEKEGRICTTYTLHTHTELPTRSNVEVD